MQKELFKRTHYRVLIVDEEAPTTEAMTWMITTWQRRSKLAKQQHSTVRLELQFLAHYKQQYNYLGDDFASNSHALKSRTALKIFKLLIELGLIGCWCLVGSPGQGRTTACKAPASASRSSPGKDTFPLPSSKQGGDCTVTAAVPVSQVEREGKGGCSHRRWRRYSKRRWRRVRHQRWRLCRRRQRCLRCLRRNRRRRWCRRWYQRRRRRLLQRSTRWRRCHPLYPYFGTTWSPDDRSSVPWMQVTIEKSSPVFLAATMAFTDPSLQKRH